MKTIQIDGVRYGYELINPKGKTVPGKIEICILENTEIEEKTTEMEMVTVSKRVNKGTKTKPKWVVEKREEPQEIEVINFKKGVKSKAFSEIPLSAKLPSLYIKKMVQAHIIQKAIKPKKAK